MKLGINYINKEEFLPAFFVAYQQTITIENIASGFKATGLALFDLEKVLVGIRPVVETTPLL
jgi:hypothetical protein